MNNTLRDDNVRFDAYRALKRINYPVNLYHMYALHVPVIFQRG